MTGKSTARLSRSALRDTSRESRPSLAGDDSLIEEEEEEEEEEEGGLVGSSWIWGARACKSANLLRKCPAYS